MEYFMQHGTYTRLRELRLVSGNGSLEGTVDAGTLQAFLAAHQGTLHTLSLRNIVLTNQYPEEIPTDTLRSFLLQCKSMHVWRKFEMILAKKAEHDKNDCPHYRDGGGHLSCANYYVRRESWIMGTDLAVLTRELGVEVEDGRWDFGKFIMRKD
ncbi:hypothetical protein CLAFUW4_06754 [Fulvia fulva]|uniref:Uncharacterized protein n=1 Tax=Passalora fulva TaxID=5499 RepID=A0A9Q8LJF0_PASFU|nr:uncharacterized protein CLAFUR5_06891 [Fulvia fulva]KAK4621911.1 hypothetical protein CLAFUR4_06762 [Fulvia fulva]KAK4622484.1 hypothetical protein CLAFUR0_06757 [Fulvia fulva]UJO18507.1 hypothetical protein CLAFUR5_06891 [Fulvia fulva]WPV15827.1 hypothetical protein CLAFUW4_06754 [Fulvia fulva]WPV31569.1 hypothetical protein CLAFUW7_06753 [Fulvia fulva]